MKTHFLIMSLKQVFLALAVLPLALALLVVLLKKIKYTVDLENQENVPIYWSKILIL